jgi:pSer/pThr/pTyr-binding forkhead associated (FHA) protein
VVSFKILSGKQAGTSWAASCFPVRIGRGAGCELRLEDPGIWDQHLALELDRATGFSLKAAPNALARVNGQPISETVLRNGDTIELGAAKIQFWLGPVNQSSLRIRESLSWSVIALTIIGQVAVLYWLLG